MKISRVLFTAVAAMLIPVCVSAVDNSVKLKGNVHGTVTDTNGKPLSGVVISDGFSAVATDAEGKYSFDRQDASYYVFCSLPAEYEVPLRQGQPVIYKKLDDRAKTYDFILKPMLGGKEKSFNLFLLGDPQSQNIHHVDRLRTEAMPDMKDYAKKQKGNCYAITLGDIGYTEGGRNTNYLLPIIRDEMSADKAGMPVFQTVGNHDFEFAAGALDANNPTVSIRRDRMFEAVFGPVNYSWNRGDVHFIAINNVRFMNLVKPGSYSMGISDEQLEWIKKDLSFVPKDKLVILTAHIPFYGKKPGNGWDPDRVHEMENALEVVKVLGEFPNAYIMSGHTHTHYKNVHENGVKEYTIAALSGCWWWSRNCADGTPNGYFVCHIEGNRIRDHIYKATGFEDDFQMRVYRGDAVYGGPVEKFAMQNGHSTLLVNVWNWEKGWLMDVYEDGKLVRTLTDPIAPSDELYPSAEGSKDWWAIGYHIGVVGRGTTGNRRDYCSRNYHMFRYDLMYPDSKVKIVVTDNYGRKFTCTHIFETAEYDAYATPPAYERDDLWLY